MSNEIDIDAWAPDPEPLRDPTAELEARHREAEQRALASIDESAAPAPALKPKGKEPPSAVAQLRAMIFASAHGGDPHIVQLVGEGEARDAACSCKAGTYNLPVGCYAMIFARTVWGLPAQEHR